MLASGRILPKVTSAMLEQERVKYAHNPFFNALCLREQAAAASPDVRLFSGTCEVLLRRVLFSPLPVLQEIVLFKDVVDPIITGVEPEQAMDVSCGPVYFRIKQATRMLGTFSK